MAPLFLYEHFFFHIVLSFNVDETDLIATSAIQLTASLVRDSGVGSAFERRQLEGLE